MRHLGPAFGPDITFLGVPRLDLGDPSQDAGVVILGAPFDGGTSYRAGARFGPSALRQACYMPHNGTRRSLALGVDALTELRVHDAGDLPCYSGEIEQSIQLIERSVRMTASSGAIPVVLGGDHTIALADMRGIAAHHGFGRIGMLHFDAHPDTGGEERGGPLYGHGKPMRQLIESGAVRGDRFIQFGLRGYWPGPETLRWMAERGMRSYEMSEIGARGLGACLTEAFGLAMDDCDGVFLSVDIDVVDPGHAPGTGTPEPGGLTARELLDAVRRAAYELPVVGLEVVEVAPPYDHADITAILGSRVVLEALSGIARRRLDTAEGRWDPAVPLLQRDLNR
ncbi:agmatinase [Streptomyces iconiensis]|uniref:Agmatinase n=1 Tax=Streptomyces iconiensis TaxID=1384038 RepID=A0ABT7A5G8_9ACTN|nr:agmatinase [Streptomyces iconiensis]MDJ1136551.1 agmatinase [Streptomyces iconiensis]